ncbi:MAG TPA: glycosyltransferase [Candidatus Peribacteraceae bacterium]|nr:glycosyltransferase [Candidatus Peribacteraceae bacterium]
MRLALAADWLTTFGGAEHVLAECIDLFPDAPLFTTLARRGSLGPLDKADIRVSRLQRWYNRTKQHQILLPWMPAAMESLDVRGFDVVLSSSHAVAKGIIVEPSTLHICYCHTPVRYAWEMEEEYLKDFNVPGFLRKPIKRQLSKLRRWDLTSAKRVDVYIANSTTTQERIQRIYNRESIVISPPVDDRFFETEIRGQRSEGSYFLAVGRLVPYKRFDLLIQVANELKLPLKIAGRGQDEERLKKLAGPTVEFLGFVPEADLPGLYADAKALLFPQYEDAGIVLLEAQATGTPAIAYNAGGARDAVIDGKTGLFFDAQTVESVRDALQRFETMQIDRDAIRAHAKQFTREKFRMKLKKVIDESFGAFRKGTFVRR